MAPARDERDVHAFGARLEPGSAPASIRCDGGQPGRALFGQQRELLLARSGWDIWLGRTGADGKRGMELAQKALGR